jgi:hypothetical protein
VVVTLMGLLLVVLVLVLHPVCDERPFRVVFFVYGDGDKSYAAGVGGSGGSRRRSRG